MRAEASCDAADLLIRGISPPATFLGVIARWHARIHEEHETLATITVRSAAEIANPTPSVK
ncbi:MAG TPA: hypothetical protein VE959_01430 [Bryobacteraceae bacterium]|nr:hypothetical protein [Bryobacteraceae bacterium]